MAELRVGHQDPVDEEGASDPGPEGEQQHGPPHSLAGTIGDLGQPRCIRVVDDHHGSTDGRADALLGRPANPLVIDVGGGRQAAILDDARQPTSNRQVGRSVRVLRQHPRDHGADRRGNGLGL